MSSTKFQRVKTGSAKAREGPVMRPSPAKRLVQARDCRIPLKITILSQEQWPGQPELFCGVTTSSLWFRALEQEDLCL